MEVYGSGSAGRLTLLLSTCSDIIGALWQKRYGNMVRLFLFPPSSVATQLPNLAAPASAGRFPKRNCAPEKQKITALIA